MGAIRTYGIRPARVSLMRRALVGVKNVARRAPQELGSAVGAMMGMPVWMVDNSDGTDISGFTSLENGFFASQPGTLLGSGPAQKALEALQTKEPLDASLQNALDNIRKGKIAAFKERKLCVKSDDLLTYFAQNTPLNQKEIQLLFKYLDKETAFNFYREFSLLVISHKPLRESDIEPMAACLDPEDWVALANHLKSQPEQEGKDILGYLELREGQEIAEHLKNLLEAIQEEKPVEEIKTVTEQPTEEVLIIREEEEKPKKETGEATLIQRFPLPPIKTPSEETRMQQVTKFVKLLALQQTFAPPAVLEEAKGDEFKLGVLLAEAEQLLSNIDYNLGVYNRQLKAFEDLYDGLSGELKGLTEAQITKLEKKLKAMPTLEKMLEEFEKPFGILEGSLGNSEGIRNLRTQIKEAVASEQERAINDIGTQKERISGILITRKGFLEIRSKWEATVGRLKRLIRMHESEKEYLTGLMANLRELGASPLSPVIFGWPKELQTTIPSIINPANASADQILKELGELSWAIESVTTLETVKRLRNQLNILEEAYPGNKALFDTMLFTRTLLFHTSLELREKQENDNQ